MKQRFSKRTRLVSALLTLAMVFTFLPISAFADYYVPLNIYTFPDETFREYISTQFDSDDDGILDTAEREAVTEIDVHEKNIRDLYGIQFFPNLKKLVCYKNQLTSLDVSQNSALEYLDCDYNQLTSLQADNCTNRRMFSCHGNEYSVQVYESTRVLDPGTLPGHFDISRVRNLTGATKNADGTMTVQPGGGKVIYEYRLLSDDYVHFTLNVTVIPDGIRIYGDNFPNYEFRQYLKANIDKDGNGYLNDTELNIRTLDVSGQHIANLKGIEFFSNLETLYCYNNKLTSLDVSKNTALKELYCYNNKLSSLDVSNNTALEKLNCCQNSLSSLDVSKNTALKDLTCQDNNLTSLDVTQNTGLVYLSCGQHPLGSLDVSKNINLKTLYCEQSNLTSLDLSQNHKLEMLYAKENRLTSLDLSKNPALEYLYCEQNNLTSLDVSKNAALKYLRCEQNQLTSLDVSQTVVSTLFADGNQIDINVETTPRTFDLSILPGFDVSKATNWNGGTVDGSTLKVDAGATQVTYTYDCGNDRNVTFTLNVNVVPDGTITPPSGGDGTGTTTPPSGGDGTGTTTPPSGGDGTGTTTPPSGGGTGTTTPPSGGDGTGTTTPPSGGGTGTTTPPSGGDGTGTTTPPSGGGTGTTTPPSGGDGTGTTTPPSGGGTGTTTPPSGGGTGTTTPPSGGGGGGAAILLVGGAAVAGLVGYGVYSYVSGQQLKALLPEGVAVPENRAQTALLLWNTAGRPEPAAQPAFPDVADPDTAKAAQWCVEQNLLQTRRDGAFAPDSTLPAYKTLKVYRQLTGK